MSAIAALKGYRTQFLYSLFYILTNPDPNTVFKLEGEEDLDVLDNHGNLKYAIQVKNLSKVLTLSDLLADRKTSFIRRFIEKYPTATPILVSFGAITPDLKDWRNQGMHISSMDQSVIEKYKITTQHWQLVKQRTEFIEVNEDDLIDQILDLLKNRYSLFDPGPTADNILYWLQSIAEKQLPITAKALFEKVEEFGQYTTQRIATAEQYGLILKPLHKTSLENADTNKLKEEFYFGVNARYEHIILGLDVMRPHFIEEIENAFKETNVVVIKGASGQGKSTLAYRYLYESSPENLVYELNVQQDVLTTQQSIQAIISITKHLQIPVNILINVAPNSIEWLKVAKEFAHFDFVQFLIAIRNEDWFKATATGIDFLHKEVDLALGKEEAKMVYTQLNERKSVQLYADFDEAWINMGTDVPMLEFVYALTQGDSLKNRLKQQTLQIAAEDRFNNNDTQSELLRIVSLVSSVGAKVDISKIKELTNLKFIIDRFEKEYLVKQSQDKKYITGLHLIRSQILVDLLFDEFATPKRDYALKCLFVVADQDLYLFLLPALYTNIITPTDIIDSLHYRSIFTWTAYHGIQRSLLWVGIKEYVEGNKLVFDECYNAYGDAWYVMINFTHGNTFDSASLFESLSLPDNIKIESSGLNARLLDKQLVYKYVIRLFNQISTPTCNPSTNLDWEGFGQILFWIKQIPNNPVVDIIQISEEVLEQVFETLELQKLSKLMLGMFYYSGYYNGMRIKLADRFLLRLRKQFNIVQIKVTDEISAHYIVDILSEDGSNNNDRSVEIIDLLRCAFPDKMKFNMQGHGHRLQLIPLHHDDTTKKISIEHLPLDEWVAINATTIKLAEFSKRPHDWKEYLTKLNAWENNIKKLITEFNAAFARHAHNVNNYKPLVPLLKNASFSYSGSLKEPQSISDQFGIYFDIEREAKRQRDKENDASKDKTQLLKSKYSLFFKGQRDFQAAIENFILQSGETLLSILGKKVDLDSAAGQDFERISQVNLFNAIVELQTYRTQKQTAFKQFGLSSESIISTNELLTTAVLWKLFLRVKKSNSNGNDFRKIYQLRKDFEMRIFRGCKALAKTFDISIDYINDKTTEYKPVLLIRSSNPAIALLGFKEAYDIVFQAVDCADYTSLKYLMLEVWFPKFYFIQLIGDFTVSGQWNEIPLHVFRDTKSESLPIHYSVPTDIDKQIVKNLTLKKWRDHIPELKGVEKMSGEYLNMRIMAEHLSDLRLFEQLNVDELGTTMTKEHVNRVGEKLKDSFQYVLDSLTNLLVMFPFDAEEYNSDELEKEYWNSLFSIKDSIFPTDKGDDEFYEFKLEIKDLDAWIERLKPSSQAMGIFCLLVYGKHINEYNKRKQNNFVAQGSESRSGV